MSRSGGLELSLFIVLDVSLGLYGGRLATLMRHYFCKLHAHLACVARIVEHPVGIFFGVNKFWFMSSTSVEVLAITGSYHQWPRRHLSVFISPLVSFGREMVFRVLVFAFQLRSRLSLANRAPGSA